MTVLDVEVLLLLVVPLLPIAAAYFLVRGWALNSPSLHERALIAVRDAVIASAVAVLAAVRLGWISLPDGVPLLVLTTALLLVSLPSAWWLYLFWRGRFR